jgi:D-alanine-D-alanine ligase
VRGDPGILILYNAPCPAAQASPGKPAESDAGVLHEVAAVAAALRELRIPFRKKGIRTLRDAGRALKDHRERLVVNLVENLEPSERNACFVPSLCLALGKQCTGNGSSCQLLALDKWQAKCSLRAAGVPVPDGTVIPPGAGPDRLSGVPPGPLIVKPLRADASECIDADSVLPDADPNRLRTAVERIHHDFGQPALVETLIEGREVNVSLLQRGKHLTVLPIAEIEFRDFPASKPRIVDYAAKWVEGCFEYRNTPRRIPAPLDEATSERVRRCALDAWHALGCQDYARIDCRIDARGAPFVIEVNPNPDLSPDAGFAAALAADGIGFTGFVRLLLKNSGFNEVRLQPFPAGDRETPLREAALQIRPSQPDDADAILRLLLETGVFRPGEIAVAREVLSDALSGGAGGHYHSLTATLHGKAAGWVCLGPTPCTEGTFDLYWMAVSPRCSRRRVGSHLLAEAEALAAARAARLIVAETSSRPDYKAARRFYRCHGYRRAACVPDFYDTGDHKLIYTKPLVTALPTT